MIVPNPHPFPPDPAAEQYIDLDQAERDTARGAVWLVVGFIACIPLTVLICAALWAIYP